MKINVIKAMPSVSLGVFTQHAKLASLWQNTTQADSLDQALTALRNNDARNELASVTSENISLLDWLEKHFDALMSQHAKHTGLSVAVCASLWHKQLVELIFPTIVALRWQYNMVPEFDASTVFLNIETNGRINTLAINEKAYVSEDQAQLDLSLTQLLTQFSQSLEPIFAKQKVNSKRFWGNLSNAMIQGFTRLMDSHSLSNSHNVNSDILVDSRQALFHSHVLDGDISKLINQWLLAVLSEKNSLVEARYVENDQQTFIYARRKVCCLKYKLNKVRMCKTCNLMDENEQADFYRHKYVSI